MHSSEQVAWHFCYHVADRNLPTIYCCQVPDWVESQGVYRFSVGFAKKRINKKTSSNCNCSRLSRQTFKLIVIFFATVHSVNMQWRHLNHQINHPLSWRVGQTLLNKCRFSKAMVSARLNSIIDTSYQKLLKSPLKCELSFSISLCMHRNIPKHI